MYLSDRLLVESERAADRSMKTHPNNQHPSLLSLGMSKSTKGKKRRIALVGGGPSALFVYKRLVESGESRLHITIYEKKKQLGSGMPYSTEGACDEHVTNVSDNEIPAIVTSVEEWIQTTSPEVQQRFRINEENFNQYKVLPRLLFGEYLSAQFALLVEMADRRGIQTIIQQDTEVLDVIDNTEKRETTVVTNQGSDRFDAVVICTGHTWPKRDEGRVPGWFDSPYPPAKLWQTANEPVAIKGSSLTAIDAVRTLARANGRFHTDEKGRLRYQRAGASENFRLVLHSLGGLLPALRVHLADTHLSKETVLSAEEVAEARALNDGFIPLDYLFRRNFKEPLRQRDPDFYARIKDLTLEEFVDSMMNLREKLDPITLLKAEYAEAETSIRRQQPVPWKEMLAVLSFAMNYPAKYLPAEDMLRLKNVLMPLISVVIAFVPQSSARELLALHEAGVLSVQAVDRNSKVVPREEGGAIYHFIDDDGVPQAIPYSLYVDCTGQPAMQYQDFPFQGLVEGKVVSEAMLPFRSGEKGKQEKEQGNRNVVQQQAQWYLKLPGIAINDHFQVLNQYNVASPKVFIMAVPYIAGFNPDYSGLDFCEAASARIVEHLLEKEVVIDRT